jgi:DNA repair protein RecO (recombination protein O)
MAYQIKTKGIVLHEMPVGDYDKRLVILTKEQGKVVAFVKGARRSNNKMLACTQIFSYGDFVLSRGKSSYNVYQGELIEHFHRLRLDIEDLTYAMYLLEFVSYVAEEEMENVALMKLLLYSLNAIEKNRVSTRLIVAIFQLKAMSIIGYTPWVNDCILCHKEDGIRYFSSEFGGFVCSDPSHLIKDKIRVNETTIYSIRYILSQPIEEVYKFTITDESLIELEYLVNQFIKENLEHQFKTLDFLRNL